MKQIILILAFIIPLFSIGQDYNLPNENLVIEFNTVTGKKLVIAIDSAENYVVYRYGTIENIELEFPKNIATSWNQFQYSWYLRGGEIQNEGMDLNYLYFEIENYRYVVYQEYYARTQKMESGIKVINLKTNERTVIKAVMKTVKGSLIDFRDFTKIKKGDELFE